MSHLPDARAGDERIALAEHVARTYGLLHGLRYTVACERVIAHQDALCDKGDHLAAMDFQLQHCDLLPPEREDPALHRAVARLRLRRELHAFVIRGWNDLSPEEARRANELLALLSPDAEPPR